MRPHPLAPRVRLTSIVAFLALVAAITCLLVVSPTYAHAKSYTMPEVNITAEVQSDGSLHVVEQRTFDFDGSFTAVWWVHDGLPSDASIQVNGVSIADLGYGGSVEEADLEPIPETPFKLEWRSAGGPGTTAYSFDEGEDTTYVFFSATDTQLLVQYDFTVVNGVQIYDDCAELYWKFVGEDWAVSSKNVTCTVSLPVPADTTPVVGTDVYAWGHGPLTGSLAFNDDASVVTYRADSVGSGQYAEARILFPVAWLTNASEEALAEHAGSQHLASVLDEEQKWADRANAERRNALIMLGGLALLTLALIIWAFVMYLRYGKEHKAAFTGDYWRDVPNRNMHPAVIARLCRWNRTSPDDFTATIMHLAHEGYISINKGTYAKPDRLGRQQLVEDYYITRGNRSMGDAHAIDKKAIEFLFDEVGGHNDSFWLSSVQRFGKQHPSRFNSKMNNWQGQVTSAVMHANYFEVKGDKLQGTMAAMAVGYAILMAAVAFFMFNLWPLLFGIIGGIALYAISNFMPRRSQLGVDDYARSMALKRWLKDFTALGERPPMDVKVWGEFMVYAYIFGVADEVIKQLRNTVPQMFAQDDAWVRTNSAYVPWYMWYDDTTLRSGSGLGSFSDMFQTTWSNTTQTAEAAIAAAQAVSTAGDFFSSGGGFGGGFSGGGGGGFGGGGGAR
ncbi:MAG: DUF2207 domain-containing protein [Eggerthellaceae bacterium]|nr:DUF2207 domain-containing protein [Eggerthellaceae bacterium]